MAAAVTDEMLDRIALAGTTDEVRAALAARLAGGGVPRDIGFLSAPGFLVGRRRRAAYARAAVALLG